VNLLERMAILCPSEPVGAATVNENLHPRGGGPRRVRAYEEEDERSLSERLESYERDVIEGALRISGDNVAEAARRLRTDRANLYRRMRRLGVRQDGPEGKAHPSSA
jgi:DNA-binding NtrC family response regulator